MAIIKGRRMLTMLVVFNIVWFVIVLITLSWKWSPWAEYGS